MKKVFKNKSGFTLVEMVLVIAIIVILAAVLIIGVGDYIKRARNAANSVSKHNSDITVAINEIDDQFNEE